MYTYGRVKPSGAMFALVMARLYSSGFASVESDAARRTNESKLSMMNESWSRGGEMRTLRYPSGSEGC
jgi:hypothetical protein